jgi:hypothetical protein
MSPAQVHNPLRRSAQPHIHRLKPLHPAVLTLLAMQHGVPMASAPMGPPRGAAAGAAWAARCRRPGGAIKPEVLANPHGALGAYRTGVVRTTTTREALTAAHLGGRAGGE